MIVESSALAEELSADVSSSVTLDFSFPSSVSLDSSPLLLLLSSPSSRHERKDVVVVVLNLGLLKLLSKQALTFIFDVGVFKKSVRYRL